MELQYFGGNCIKINAKKASIVVDDNLDSLGQKSIQTEKDIALFTSPHVKNDRGAYFRIDGPGEYEVSDISIQGISARAHIDEEKTLNATMYRIIVDDTRIAVVGHIHPDLTEDELEALGTIDILVIPIGGSGYTLDGIGAHKVINKISPKIVIPTHYADKGLNYEVPQSPLEEAVKPIGIEPSDTLDSLKLKNAEYGEGAKLIVLNRK
jgi:hypothetical protein